MGFLIKIVPFLDVEIKEEHLEPEIEIKQENGVILGIAYFIYCFFNFS